jgi:RNA 2',3'-cyclic 3'-phosphodiesterase
VRLFAALEVPPHIRAELDEVLDDVRPRWADLRWTPQEQWHVTVAFIGHTDRDPDEVTAGLDEAVRNTPERIRLSLGGAGRFGGRVLWVRVDDDPDGSVAALGASAQAALEGAGLPVDRKAVRPHLTLARAVRRGRRGISASLVEAVPRVDATWEVGELLLLASVPQGHGRPNRYEPQSHLPLGGGTAP